MEEVSTSKIRDEEKEPHMSAKKTEKKDGKHHPKKGETKEEEKHPKKESPKVEEGEKKKSMRAALLSLIEKTRAHKKSSLGERSKLVVRFQKDFPDREVKAVQDAIVRYINDAKVHPLGKYLLTEDEGGIGITKTKSEKK